MAATGSQTDIIGHLQDWLPQGWFPNTAGTRIYAILSGFASVLSTIYSLITYTKMQTRVATATDGFLDLASQDYLGSNLPRLLGETDTAFSARIRASVFLAANTRPAIQKALENLTGNPVRMIEPWQPNDTFVWGRSFWGVDTRFTPGQWANGNQRYSGLIECTLPDNSMANLPRSWWGKWFWNFVSAFAPGAGNWWLGFIGVNGPQQVYAAILRLKVYGTSIFVRFVSLSELQGPSHQVLTTPQGVILTTPGGAELTT